MRARAVEEALALRRRHVMVDPEAEGRHAFACSSPVQPLKVASLLSGGARLSGLGSAAKRCGPPRSGEIQCNGVAPRNSGESSERVGAKRRAPRWVVHLLRAAS